MRAAGRLSRLVNARTAIALPPNRDPNQVGGGGDDAHESKHEGQSRIIGGVAAMRNSQGTKKNEVGSRDRMGTRDRRLGEGRTPHAVAGGVGREVVAWCRQSLARPVRLSGASLPPSEVRFLAGGPVGFVDL